MNSENLEMNQREIEEYKRIDKELSNRLAEKEKVGTRELAAQHLLNFELARLNAEILAYKEEILKLEQERDQLENSATQLMFFLKRVRNSTILSNIRCDRKDIWITSLKQGLETMDFTAEKYSDDPQLSINAYTQLDPFERRRMVP